MSGDGKKKTGLDAYDWAFVILLCLIVASCVVGGGGGGSGLRFGCGRYC